MTSGSSTRPTTAEVLLAKKQLKMEGMIRKLLVQQQESDSTIAELSDALSRMEPEQRERLNLHDMTAQLRSGKNGKKPLGVQHHNGSPATKERQTNPAPWGKEEKLNQDIVTALHPDGELTGRSDRDRSLVSNLAGKQTKSLVAPGTLFQPGKNSSFHLTSSPNNNPADLLKYQDKKDRYKKPAIPRHLDSHVVKESLTKWGTDTQVENWEKNADKWHTHNEEVHGYSNFTPAKERTGRKASHRPQSAMSRGKSHRKSTGRPQSAMSRKSGSTNADLGWTGTGYTKEVYDQLGAEGSEMHFRVQHDPELIVGPTRFNADGKSSALLV